MGSAPDGSLIVVEAGRFTLCPCDRNATTELDVEQVIGSLSRFDTTVRTAASATADPIVYPGRAVATTHRDGGLVTYLDVQQRWVLLSPDHLRVLAAVDGPVKLSHLAEINAMSHPACAQLVDDLAVTGVLTVEAAARGSDDPASSDPPTPTPMTAAPAATRPERSTRGLVLDRITSWIGRGPRSRTTTSPHEPAPPAPARVERPTSAPARSVDPRVPVHSFWATPEGPHMGAAAVTAYARVHNGGVLNNTFDLRKARQAADVLEEIAASEQPAILLCSDYLWSIEANRDVARAAQEGRDDVLIIHGGPSAPRQESDCRSFLEQLPPGHVVVSGEGETAFAEVLTRLAQGLADEGRLDLDRIEGITGTSFRSHDGRIVVNPPRDRHNDLDDFPSPLLSGELDLVPLDVLRQSSIPVETVRGCPYGCTFCDWGQATMSRIRKFPEARVVADLRWLAEHHVEFVVIADANWGILPRDLTVAQHIAEIHRETGYPKFVGAGPPKTSTDRYVAIVDTLLSAGVSLKAAIAFQSRDQATLDAVHRSNIKTTTYDRIVDEMRSRGLPLHCELMLGLPGATVESLKADLQWCIEENVRPHIYRTFVLPNAPMNDPAYKARHGVEVDGGMIVATSSYTRDEGELMWRLAYAFQALEFLGLARYTLRLLQWDHGMRAMDVVHRMLDAVDRSPSRFPLTAFVLRHFEQFVIPPVGWGPFYDELHELLTGECGAPDDSSLHTALIVDRHTTPWPQRPTPFSIELDHDYVAWFTANNLNTHWSVEQPTSGRDPLLSFPPGILEVLADPDGISEHGLGRQVDPVTPVFPGFVTAFWEVCHLELLSPISMYEPMTHSYVEASRRHFPPAVHPVGDPKHRHLDRSEIDDVTVQPVTIGHRR